MGKQVTIEIVDGKLIYDLVPSDSLVRTPKARKPSKPVQLEKRVSEEPAPLPTRSTLQSVYVDGSINHSRYLVRINGVDVLLRGKSFLYFTVLAVNRTRGGGGWTHKTDVEAGENQIKYFYQLRRELTRASAGCGHIIENDGTGRYRLGVDPKAITFNEEGLRQHDDSRISSLFNS